LSPTYLTIRQDSLHSQTDTAGRPAGGRVEIRNEEVSRMGY